MRNILLIFLAMTLCSKLKDTNEKFVSICKVSNDTIRVDYFDSTHGIISIDSNANGDTLLLKINVGLMKSKKSIDVKLFDGAKFINTGAIVYQIDKIEYCKKVYSGQDALEQLKNNK